jgi:hypothetical protein
MQASSGTQQFQGTIAFGTGKTKVVEFDFTANSAVKTAGFRFQDQFRPLGGRAIRDVRQFDHAARPAAREPMIAPRGNSLR